MNNLQSHEAMRAALSMAVKWHNWCW